MRKEWFEIFHNTGSKIIHVPQCAKVSLIRITYTMPKEESMLAKLPQLNSLKNLVEETLIVSIKWNVLCDIFDKTM